MLLLLLKDGGGWILDTEQITNINIVRRRTAGRRTASCSMVAGVRDTRGYFLCIAQPYQARIAVFLDTIRYWYWNNWKFVYYFFIVMCVQCIMCTINIHNNIIIWKKTRSTKKATELWPARPFNDFECRIIYYARYSRKMYECYF